MEKSKQFANELKALMKKYDVEFKVIDDYNCEEECVGSMKLFIIGGYKFELNEILELADENS